MSKLSTLLAFLHILKPFEVFREYEQCCFVGTEVMQHWGNLWGRKIQGRKSLSVNFEPNAKTWNCVLGKNYGHSTLRYSLKVAGMTGTRGLIYSLIKTKSDKNRQGRGIRAHWTKWIITESNLNGPRIRVRQTPTLLEIFNQRYSKSNIGSDNIW